MRYAAIISYLGTRYVGWQRQINGLSVQEVLENALKKAFGEDVKTVASGRTDAGVHAEGQVVHFDAETKIPCDKIPFAVNAYLPDDVSMLKCFPAPEDFNARFSAKKKTYCYNLYLSEHVLPLYEITHERICVPLDISEMKRAAKEIVGTHDFKCFEATGSVVKNTERTVYGIDIETVPIAEAAGVFGENAEKKDKENGNEKAFSCEIKISVTGNGFLYNMVRIIAGTLVYCGMGKLSSSDVRTAIEKKDRTMSGKTLSAKGLILKSVKY